MKGQIEEKLSGGRGAMLACREVAQRFPRFWGRTKVEGEDALTHDEFDRIWVLPLHFLTNRSRIRRGDIGATIIATIIFTTSESVAVGIPPNILPN